MKEVVDMESRKSPHSEMTFGGTGHSQKMWVVLDTINEESSSCMYLPSQEHFGICLQLEGRSEHFTVLSYLNKLCEAQGKKCTGFLLDVWSKK